LLQGESAESSSAESSYKSEGNCKKAYGTIKNERWFRTKPPDRQKEILKSRKETNHRLYVKNKALKASKQGVHINEVPTIGVEQLATNLPSFEESTQEDNVQEGSKARIEDRMVVEVDQEPSEEENYEETIKYSLIFYRLSLLCLSL
jgi:hypothetical protein